MLSGTLELVRNTSVVFDFTFDGDQETVNNLLQVFYGLYFTPVSSCPDAFRCRLWLRTVILCDYNAPLPRATDLLYPCLARLAGLINLAGYLGHWLIFVQLLTTTLAIHDGRVPILQNLPIRGCQLLRCWYGAESLRPVNQLSGLLFFGTGMNL